MNETVEKKRYTMADLISWPDEPRYELIEGEPVLFATPMRRHQEAVLNLATVIRNYLRGKTCRVFIAPFGVRLFEKIGDRPENTDTLVEPDICVVCDQDKLDDYGCKGAPDMVVEVLSPSNRQYDLRTKYRLYEKAGVREYWVVDPDTNSVAVHLLEDGFYGSPVVYISSAKIKVEVLDDCWIDLEEVFSE